MTTGMFVSSYSRAKRAVVSAIQCSRGMSTVLGSSASTGAESALCRCAHDAGRHGDISMSVSQQPLIWVTSEIAPELDESGAAVDPKCIRAQSSIDNSGLSAAFTRFTATTAAASSSLAESVPLYLCSSSRPSQ